MDSKRTSRRIGLGMVLLCTFALSRPVDSADGGSVAKYLHIADRQCESAGQEKEIERALTDMIKLTPQALRKQRYFDYQLKKRTWDAPTLLHRYFVPSSRIYLDAETFYADVRRPAAKAAIIAQLKALHDHRQVRGDQE